VSPNTVGHFKESTKPEAVPNDALIRDGHVANRPFYIAVSVNLKGNKDAVGPWTGAEARRSG
jgi:hypothetical protein